MARFFLPIRTSLVTTIILMGVIGVALTFMATEVYHQANIKDHKSQLQNLISLKANDLLEELKQDGGQLALNAQHHPEFRRAFASRKSHDIDRQLETEFHQFFVTANVIRLIQLAAFDTEYQLLGRVSLPDSTTGNYDLQCDGFLQKAKSRKGHNRIKTFSQLCISGNKPLFGLVVPIGSLKPVGYLVLLANPVDKLMDIEKQLGLPLRISAADNQILYQSQTWPTDIDDSSLTAEIVLKTPDNKSVLKIAVTKEIAPLLHKLHSTRRMVLLITALATFIGVFLSLFIVKTTIFQPLHKLNEIVKKHSLQDTLNTDSLHTMNDIEIIGAPAISELYHNLQQMAQTDPLTMLRNRTLFYESINRLLSYARRMNEKAAVILIDLDGFKCINDSMGHHIGDLLLKTVADQLRHIMRGYDEIIRYGGDEFVILLPTTDEAQADIIGHKILTHFKKPFVLEEHTIRAEMSIGVSLFPDHGEHPKQIMKAADKAMYSAKKSESKLIIYSRNNQSP